MKLMSFQKNVNDEIKFKRSRDFEQNIIIEERDWKCDGKFVFG